MSNVDVYVVCEGQTEKNFVKLVLAPYMAERGITLFAPIIGAVGHKGGNVSFERAKTDIQRFLLQRPAAYVTSFFDFYGLGHGWRGVERVAHANGSTASQKAHIMESTTQDDIQNFCGASAQRFIPFFVMHEFEALLFSDTECLACETNIDKETLDRIVEQFASPEEINNSPETAPSKRILALDHGYRKVASGTSITEAIGINGIRAKCPLFNAWVAKLEALAA